MTSRREAPVAVPASAPPAAAALSGLRSDSSVLFHLDNLTSLTPAAARLPRQEMDPSALEDEGFDKTPPPTLLPADHHSGIIDLHGLQLSAEAPAGAPVTPFILQPRQAGTYVPRWFWGIAAGAAAALIAVVVLTIQLLTPDAAPAELAAAAAPAVAAPGAAPAVPPAAPAARPSAALPSTKTLGSSSLVATRDEDYRPRPKRAAKARRSRRMARAGALADAAPAAAPARSSGPDELDALLGRGIGGRR